MYYHRFKKAFKLAEYHIVDNNEFGLNLFRQKNENTAHLHKFDLLKSDIGNLGITADIVFSSGLIEHFVPEDTKNIVESHFAITKGGGLVLLSFPTPTLIYWAFRRFLEATDKFPPLLRDPSNGTKLKPSQTGWANN